MDHCSGTNQASDPVLTSNSESQPTDQISTLRGTTDRETAAITNGADSLTAAAASQPSELSANESQAADAESGEIKNDGMDIETSTTNGMAEKPQTTNETRELPIINGEDVQESSTDGQAVVQ